MNITPDPIFFWAFLGCVIFLLLVYKIILDIVQAHRRKPPLEAEFATKTELGKLEAEFRRMRDEMRDTYDRISLNDETRSSKIHDRVDDVLTAVSELKGIIKNVPCLRSSQIKCPD